MSKITPVPKPPQRFDLQKFETMNEPFSLRVEKFKGSMKYDVTPPAPDEAGWTKDRIRQLEVWIVNEWSGGGHYTLAITDSSAPPQTMEWTSYYPPSDFPDKIPPTLQGAVAPLPASAPPPPTSMPQVTPLRQPVMPSASFYTMPAAPGSMPQVIGGQPMTMPQPSFFPQAQGYAQPWQQPWHHSSAPASSTENAELRAAREEVQRAREAAAQREFERRTAEIESRSDKRFGELQALIQQMGQQFQQGMQQARPAIDPVVEQLKEQNRQLADQLRSLTENGERARREAELRDQIRAGQEETRRLIDATNQRYEQVLREAGNKGPDPQFLLMMETMKQFASSAQAQFDRMQHLMMRPQDMLAIAKESSQSTEHVVGNIARQYESMFSLARALTEQAAQLNQGGGGNEVIGLVRDIGDKIGDWAGRYTGGKSREAVEQMRAQAEIAKANAKAIEATQARMAELARIEAGLKSGQVVQMPDGTFRGPGNEPISIPSMSGPSGETQVEQTSSARANGANGKNGAHAMPWVAPKTPRTDGSNAGLAGAPQPSPQPQPQGGQVVQMKRKIKGKTDEEWFGPMAADVGRLRQAVALFVDGTSRVPPEKPEDSASPPECALVIQQAAHEIMSRNLMDLIPAMRDMLLQGAVADFLDVLLPDAPQLYRDDVVQALMAMGGEDQADDDDADDDDDGDDAGDGNDADQAQA